MILGSWGQMGCFRHMYSYMLSCSLQVVKPGITVFVALSSPSGGFKTTAPLYIMRLVTRLPMKEIWLLESTFGNGSDSNALLFIARVCSTKITTIKFPIKVEYSTKPCNIPHYRWAEILSQSKITVNFLSLSPLQVHLVRPCRSFLRWTAKPRSTSQNFCLFNTFVFQPNTTRGPRRLTCPALDSNIHLVAIALHNNKRAWLGRATLHSRLASITSTRRRNGY